MPTLLSYHAPLGYFTWLWTPAVRAQISHIVCSPCETAHPPEPPVSFLDESGLLDQPVPGHYSFFPLAYPPRNPPYMLLAEPTKLALLAPADTKDPQSDPDLYQLDHSFRDEEWVSVWQDGDRVYGQTSDNVHEINVLKCGISSFSLFPYQTIAFYCSDSPFFRFPACCVTSLHDHMLLLRDDGNLTLINADHDKILWSVPVFEENSASLSDMAFFKVQLDAAGNLHAMRPFQKCWTLTPCFASDLH